MICGRWGRGRPPARASLSTGGLRGLGFAGRATLVPMTRAESLLLRVSLVGRRVGKRAKDFMPACISVRTPMGAVDAVGSPTLRTGGPLLAPLVRSRRFGEAWMCGRKGSKQWRVSWAVRPLLGAGRSRTQVLGLLRGQAPRALSSDPRWRAPWGVQVGPPRWLPPFWPGTEVICVLAWPGKPCVVHAFRWPVEGTWKLSGTRGAPALFLWKKCRRSSGTVSGGWELWPPARQGLRDASPKPRR